MNTELIVGLVVMFVPLFAGGYLMLRNQTSIFRMFVAMLLIGLGYLTMTGAVNEIGAKVLNKVPVMAPAAVPATAPAPAAAPAK